MKHLYTMIDDFVIYEITNSSYCQLLGDKMKMMEFIISCRSFY